MSKAFVTEVEDRVGTTLPDGFKYIMTHFSPLYLDETKTFEVDWRRIDHEPLSVEEQEDFERTFGIRAFSDEATLRKEISFLLDTPPCVTPKNLIPVATDMSGMYLLMDLSPEKHGTIWAWFPSSDPWGQENNMYIGFMADSYEDFLFNRMQEPPEDW